MGRGHSKSPVNTMLEKSCILGIKKGTYENGGISPQQVLDIDRGETEAQFGWSSILSCKALGSKSWELCKSSNLYGFWCLTFICLKTKGLCTSNNLCPKMISTVYVYVHKTNHLHCPSSMQRGWSAAGKLPLLLWQVYWLDSSVNYVWYYIKEIFCGLFSNIAESVKQKKSLGFRSSLFCTFK